MQLLALQRDNEALKQERDLLRIQVDRVTTDLDHSKELHRSASD